MSRHGRRFAYRPGSRAACGREFTFLLAFLACSLFAIAPTASQLIDWPAPDSWSEDAELTDIFCVDGTQAWVVGDRGTVLHTTDGGENWLNIQLGVLCRLESVYFVDDRFGWIVGGYHIPGAASSQSVIFRTTDGGKNWKRLRGLTIPKLNQIRFIDAHHGWALGEGNAKHPSGMFETADGGKTWSGISRGKIHSWRAGDRFANQWAVIGIHGASAFRMTDELEPMQMRQSPAPPLKQLKLVDRRHGFAVGDQGTFLTTVNGGLAWHPHESSPSDPSIRAFDFHALFQLGNHVWLGGSPGSYVFRLDQRTGAWHKSRTPMRGRINRMGFVNANIGWAIGNTGEIIRTDDGGKTWQRQRSGIARLAILQIVRIETQISSEILAKYCCEENLLSGVIIWRDRVVDNWHEAHVADERARQACGRLGNSTFLSCSGGNRSATSARSMLTKHIRRLRPSIVVLPGEEQDVEFRSRILEAVHDAADGQRFVDHILEIGLAPWSVSRVVVHHRGSGEFQISNHEFLPGWGCLIGDLVMTSRLLLGQTALQDQPLALTTIQSSPIAAGSRDLVPHDDTIRRRATTRASGNLSLMRKLARKRKTIEQLAAMPASPSESKSSWTRQLVSEIGQLDPATAGVWLYELADAYDRLGMSEWAAATNSYLARTYGDHPLSVLALRWLYNHYASLEKCLLHQRRLDALQPDSLPQVGAGNPAPLTRPVTTIENGIVKTEWRPVQPPPNSSAPDPLHGSRSEVAQVAWIEEQVNFLRLRRFQQAKRIMQSLGLRDFSAAHTERMWLSQVKLNRRLDADVAIDNQLKSIALHQAYPAVAAAAKRELQLRGLASGSIEPSFNCVEAEFPPKLDGRLDEAFWQRSEKNHLAHQESELSSGDFIQFACDDDYLYIAVSCQKQTGKNYESLSVPRERDADLSQSDRVEISLDIDRDFTTYFLLSVDGSGRVADSCAGNIAWNPTWYVASHQDAQRWYAEAAIRLDEIRGAESDVNWCVSADRFIRDRAQASWPEPIQNSSAQQARKSRHQMTLARDLAIYHPPVQSFGILRLPAIVNSQSNDADTDKPGLTETRKD